MVIPVIESSTKTGLQLTSSITLDRPTGVTVGDLLIIIVCNDDQSDTPQFDDSTNKPTGFNLIGEAGGSTSDCHTGAFWRIADGTEAATIVCPAQSIDDMVGFYLRISGAHASSPIDVVGADNAFGASASHDVTGATTTVADCLAFAAFTGDGADMYGFGISGTGWSLGDEQDDGGGAAQCSGGYALKDMASAGATGTCTIEGAVSDGLSGFQFAIAPEETGGGAEITTTGVPSGEAFGSATVTADREITTIGVPSGEAFGSATVNTDQQITTTGVPTGEGFGSATVTADREITTTGVPSGEAFGSATVTADREITTIGVPSGEAFGSATVNTDQQITTTGVPTGEGFGSATVTADREITTTGVPTGEAFGALAVEAEQQIETTGVASGEAFGLLQVVSTGTQEITLSGLDSGEAVGGAVCEGGARRVRVLRRGRYPRDDSMFLPTRAEEGAIMFFYNGAWWELPIGPNGSVLTISGGRPQWA